VEPLTEDVEEKPLEEIFAMRPDMLQPVIPEVEEDEEEEGSDKGKPAKKKKGKKKFTELEYDPDLDETIAHKKHKRDDETWEEW